MSNPVETLEALMQKANYDESKVPTYTLPDPLTLDDGQPVTNAQTWLEKRRPEIFAKFAELVYGRTPTKQIKVTSEILRTNPAVLNGKVTSIEVQLTFGEQAQPNMVLLIFLPNQATGRVPLFIGLNFSGNQTVLYDPGLLITEKWTREFPERGFVNNRATEASRGVGAENWQVEMLIDRGYGLATAYYGDLDPDFDDGFQNGVQPLFYEAGQTSPAPNEWGAIGAWAWGLSRAVDYLETLPAVDAKKIALIGHSRLGKAALWAGAQDERFAIVISNNSGCGGAAIGRREVGETYVFINRAFPHWFCQNFHAYSNREADLPVDAHELLALMAPRPVYVASASEDLWADPKGELLAAEQAGPVYRLFGLPGLEGPENEKRWVGYHLREGKHDVTAFDWQHYLDFADKHFGGGV